MVQKLHGVFKSTGIPQGMATGPASVLADGWSVCGNVQAHPFR